MSYSYIRIQFSIKIKVKDNTYRSQFFHQTLNEDPIRLFCQESNFVYKSKFPLFLGDKELLKESRILLLILNAVLEATGHTRTTKISWATFDRIQYLTPLIFTKLEHQTDHLVPHKEMESCFYFMITLCHSRQFPP